VLATAFTFSCSSDDSKDDGGGAGYVACKLSIPAQSGGGSRCKSSWSNNVNADKQDCKTRFGGEGLNDCPSGAVVECSHERSVCINGTKKLYLYGEAHKDNIVSETPKCDNGTITTKTSKLYLYGDAHEGKICSNVWDEYDF